MCADIGVASSKAAAMHTCPANAIGKLDVASTPPQLHNDCIVPERRRMVQRCAPLIVHSVYLALQHAAHARDCLHMPLMRSHVQGSAPLQAHQLVWSWTYRHRNSRPLAMPKVGLHMK